MPDSGLTPVTDGFGQSIAPLVHVTAGPVNISDITVDGTGNTVGGYPTFLVGILYDSGSSGTINEVTVRNLSNSGEAFGVWAENTSGTNESVTIENSSFHDIDNTAVLTVGDNLLVTVKGNTMQARAIQVQFYTFGGSLTANVLNGGYYGMLAAREVTISGNTLANQIYEGILASGGVTATSNKISNAPTGIYDDGGSNTYKSNTITNAGVGIQFNCNTPTVLSNTINDATTGLDNVPSGFSGANSFNNVATLRTNCGSNAIHGPDLPAPHSGPLRAPAH